MKAWIPFTLVFALGTAAHAQATCTYPRSPDAPPDGNTATKDQMIAAKHDFDRYNGEMNSYLDCLKLEMDAATPKETWIADQFNAAWKLATEDERAVALVYVEKWREQQQRH